MAATDGALVAVVVVTVLLSETIGQITLPKRLYLIDITECLLYLLHTHSSGNKLYDMGTDFCA